MSQKLDNNVYCMCGDDSFYDWDKEGNKCVTCGNDIRNDIPEEENEIFLMKKYKFIHPVTASKYIIHCEELYLSDGYWECRTNGLIHHQFPISYAMIKLNATI